MGQRECVVTHDVTIKTFNVVYYWQHQHSPQLRALTDLSPTQFITVQLFNTLRQQQTNKTIPADTFQVSSPRWSKCERWFGERITWIVYDTRNG